MESSDKKFNDRVIKCKKLIDIFKIECKDYKANKANYNSNVNLKLACDDINYAMFACLIYYNH